METLISKHAKKRAKKRLGLNFKALIRMSNKVLHECEKEFISETRAYRYIYANNVFIFREHPHKNQRVLITVLNWDYTRRLEDEDVYYRGNKNNYRDTRFR